MSENNEDVFIASSYGHLNKLKQLLDERKLSVNILDGYGNTLLHWACYRNHKDVVEYLLNNGIDHSIKNKEQKQTALHWAIAGGNLGIVHLLNKYSINNYEECDINGYNSLFIAVQNEHINIIHYLMLRNVNINSVDLNGSTALHWASIKGNTSIARYLINSGADPWIQDNYGSTPLHWSCYRGNKEIVNYYCSTIKDHSYYEIKDANGKTAFDYAQQHKEIRDCIYSNVILKPKLNLSHRVMWMLWFSLPWIFYLTLTILSLMKIHLSIIVLFLAILVFAMKVIFTPYYDPKKKNPLIIGVFYSTFFMTMTMFFIYCFLYELERNLIFVNIICMIAFLMILLHLQLVKNDPGRLNIDKQEDSKAFIEEIEKGQKISEICSTCHVRKPIRSKHCPVTNQCIIKFDHYCVWIYNSVGINNHRKFMILLLIGFISHFIILIPFIRGFNRLLPEKPSYYDYYETISNHFVFVFIILIQPLNILWESQLIFTQFMLILQGLTYNEAINWKSYPAFRKIVGNSMIRHNPFDKGRLKNFIDFWINPQKEYYTKLYHLENNEDLV